MGILARPSLGTLLAKAEGNVNRNLPELAVCKYLLLSLVCLSISFWNAIDKGLRTLKKVKALPADRLDHDEDDNKGPLGFCRGYIGIMEKRMETTGIIEII